MTLGSGTHVYELVEGWPALPEGVQLSYTHGAVVDARDNVYIFNQSKHALLVFDRDGKFIRSFGEEFAAGAHGLYLSREGDEEFLFLVDYAIPAVVKVTLEGREVLRLAAPDLPEVYSAEKPYKPTDVCVAPNGDIYVCDGYGQSWIHQYTRGGEYIRSFGGPGSEPGRLSCPHGIWIDTRNGAPRLLVADRANVRIQVFTLDGKPDGFIIDEGLRYPCCFYIAGDELYIPDLHGVISIYDKNNRLITQVGDNPDVWKQPGWPNIPHGDRIPGKFISPHALCVDSRGDIYVVEWVSDGRITKLRRAR